ENVRSVRGIIARLAAIRLLPIRSLYSRYSATKAAAMATMPLPRNVDAVRIENVRPIGGIAQTITGTLNSMRPSPETPFVFTSERGSPFTTAGFARMVERVGAEAKLGFKVHPHMLRHACGYALANRGHDTRALQAYLGHRNIQHMVRYTELSP